MNANVKIENNSSKIDDIHRYITKRPKVITVGGGKGGVGKTLFSLLLGLGLVHKKKKVVIVDADFRSPSLNSLLKIKSPAISLKDFFSQKNININDVIQKTNFKNLDILGGITGVLGYTEYCFKHCSSLEKNLHNIDADFIIVDLESGTSIEAINLFLSADERIIIANPNPMSIQENYSFLKLCQFKKLRDIFKKKSNFFNLIKETYESNNSKNFQKLKKELEKLSLTNDRIKLDYLRPKLILNKIRNKNESGDALAFQIVCEDLLGVNLEFWGNIAYNNRMRSLIKNGNLKKLCSIKTISNVTNKLVDDFTTSKTLKNNGIRKRSIDYFNHDDITCSIQCKLWESCVYKNGGFPCKLKYMGFLCTSTETVQ